MNAIAERNIKADASDFKSSVGSRMMKDVAVTAFLQEHCELRIAAQETAEALRQAFEHAELRVQIDADPETGTERLHFEVNAEGVGRELRQKLRDFVRTDLPQSAKVVRDFFVFSVNMM